MKTYRVTSIDKPSLYIKIKSLAGPGWIKTEEQVIKEINNDESQFFVRNGVYSSWIKVVYGSSSSRPFLKTITDGNTIDNLTFLPECP